MVKSVGWVLKMRIMEDKSGCEGRKNGWDRSEYRERVVLYIESIESLKQSSHRNFPYKDGMAMWSHATSSMNQSIPSHYSIKSTWVISAVSYGLVLNPYLRRFSLLFPFAVLYLSISWSLAPGPISGVGSIELRNRLNDCKLATLSK